MNANPLSLFWEGFLLESHDQPEPQRLHLRLVPAPTHVPICGRCGTPNNRIHDVSERRVRERDLFDHRVTLTVPVRRLRCKQCGPTTERISWLQGKRPLTRLMTQYVEVLSRIMPIKHVAELIGLHWHTVRSIDLDRLKRDVVDPDLSRLRRIIMDEFALFKGHRYATVAICADTQQVLWMGEGRSREAVKPFFEWLGPDVCRQIVAVAMDMNSALDLEVQANCPNAEVIYDLFHVIAKFGREVIDRVRVDQANRLRDRPHDRKVIKRSRWILLRNKENLVGAQSVDLEELLAANAPLATVYILKDQMKELWFAPSTQVARERWNDWLRLALESAIAPLVQFANRLKPYAHGIIASARHRLNTSVLEGMNNKIKVIKRMAYGYRDSSYFFLKVKDAFPAKMR